jgi:23S rRNA (pseudouridine1915-N3)-methyltransferase
MRYQLVAIGSLKRSFYAGGCKFFLERLKPFGKFELIELKETQSDNALKVKAQEGAALLAAASGYLVGLDERGKQFKSVEVADWISALENRGVSKMSFLLGGAEGHSEELKSQCAFLWSLSSLTFPHDLARLVVVEQLYRAETIRAGHPYHRE